MNKKIAQRFIELAETATKIKNSQYSQRSHSGAYFGESDQRFRSYPITC